MPKKYVYSKPSSTHETAGLRVGLHLYEATEPSEYAGQLVGSANLLDNKGDIITTMELAPNQLELFQQGVGFITSLLHKRANVVEHELPDPEPEKAP